MNRRCEWCLQDPLYVAYHDQEWGVPEKSDAVLFEFLLLEGAQAGLSWFTVLKKRENYRRAFDGFDPEIIARYDGAKEAMLLADAGIIRNRLKVKAAIKNAAAYLAICESEPSFSEFIWSFVEHKPIQNRWRTLAEVPATTDGSDRMAKALKERGFTFVGSTICYAFMQAVGMVNDHLVNCDRYEPCRDLGLN